MMEKLTNIARRPAGRLTRSEVTNELADAVNAMQPVIRTGQPFDDPPISAPGMLFGKATAAVTGGTNTVTLDPCLEDGTDTGAANLSVYLYLPKNYTVLADSIDIKLNDVLGYWPFDESGTPKGVLVSVPLNTGPCTP